MNKDLKVMIVETYQKVEDLKWLSQDYITLFNKPENKDLGAERFFLRCEHAISTLKEIIELKFMARKEELQFLIEGAKAEKNEHSINLNQNELNLLTVNDFNVGFSDLAGHDCSEHSPIKSIKLKDIEVISNAIEEARAKILTGKPDATTPKLTIEEAALYYVYDGQLITRENANEKIQDFGNKSGDRLYNWYVYHSNPSNRRGEPGYPSKTKVQNKIDRIKKVIPLLPEHKQQLPIDEIKILKVIMENLP